MPATLEPFTSSTDFVNERRGWHPGCGSFFACLTFPEITTSDVRAFLRRPETRRCVPPLGAGDNVRSNSTLLTCSSMSTIEQQIVDRADGQISDWILYGCDAVELRADLLRDWTEDFVHAQVQLGPVLGVVWNEFDSTSYCENSFSVHMPKLFRYRPDCSPAA
jgi:hypothetical protein